MRAPTRWTILVKLPEPGSEGSKVNSLPEPGRYIAAVAGLVDVKRVYVGAARLDGCLLSPIKGDPSGLLPTLFLTRNRDWFLSGTSLFHRAIMRASADPELVVFEGLNHGLWVSTPPPGPNEAYRIAVKFFVNHLRSR